LYAIAGNADTAVAELYSPRYEGKSIAFFQTQSDGTMQQVLNATLAFGLYEALSTMSFPTQEEAPTNRATS